jgi:RND superfamily putative drug exporter
MARMARWCFHKRWAVLISWVVVLVVVGAASQALKATYSNDYNLPKTDSSEARPS